MGLKLRGWLLLFGVLGVAAATIVLPRSSVRPYPECDDGRVKAALGLLYDNRRLLHATDLDAIRHLRDGFSARYCVVTVKWQDGSERDVPYEFDRQSAKYCSYNSFFSN